MRRAGLKPDEEARSTLGVGCSGFGLRAIYLDLDCPKVDGRGIFEFSEVRLHCSVEQFVAERMKRRTSDSR